MKSSNFVKENEIPREPAGEGVTRQIMGYDSTLMMVKVDFRKGAVGYEHSHIHSQTTFVASGKFEVSINGKMQILCQGDGFYAEPNCIHGVVCLEEGTLIDTFSPAREDFLKK